MPSLPLFLREVSSHFGTKEASKLQDAYAMAHQIYGAERYVTGEALIKHVEEIVTLLLPLHPDAGTLIATLLSHVHDPKDLRAIEKKFGKDIRSIIASLNILEGECWKANRSSADLHRMALALSRDIRVLLICIHCRLHALAQANRLEEKQRIVLAREVLDVFAPLCAKLGIYALKYTLEALAFDTLYPQEATEIGYAFDAIKRKQGNFLEASQRSIERLLQEQGEDAKIAARRKQPYSIFRKMHRKGVTAMADLYDLFGMRILVETIEDCYKVLGMLHGTHRPILHRIKDYIGMPKPNGYRSLHTTLLGLSPESPSMPIEVQIRTHEMDEEAEFGIAAHWNYKEKGTEKPLMSKAWTERMQSLQKLSSEEGSESEDSLHEELSDRIFVLTPKGDPIELPKGSTPLDFAFRIHTDLGLRFRMAKVNGAIAPLDQLLENGDMVEIQTWREPRPSEQWIQIVRTKDARSKIRTYFQKNPQRRAMIGQR